DPRSAALVGDAGHDDLAVGLHRHRIGASVVHDGGAVTVVGGVHGTARGEPRPWATRFGATHRRYLAIVLDGHAFDRKQLSADVGAGHAITVEGGVQDPVGREPRQDRADIRVIGVIDVAGHHDLAVGLHRDRINAVVVVVDGAEVGLGHAVAVEGHVQR